MNGAGLGILLRVLIATTYSGFAGQILLLVDWCGVF
jgi:hypothetical protein